MSNERFPRLNRYDPKWILDNQIGINPLWLTEWVCEKMPLAPGIRLLDLGCGKDLSSLGTGVLDLAYSRLVAAALGTDWIGGGGMRGRAAGCLEAVAAMETSPRKS